jgi:hypothetical protein
VADPGIRHADDGDGQRERQLGAAIISRLHAVLRGIRLTRRQQSALRAQLQELLDAINALMEDELSLLGMGEYFYVNGFRLRSDGAQAAVFRALLGEFEVREVGGLRFETGLSIDELDTFVRVFHAAAKNPGMTALDAALASAGVRHVGPIRAQEAAASQAEDTTGEGADGEKLRARKVHRRPCRARATCCSAPPAPGGRRCNRRAAWCSRSWTSCCGTPTTWWAW